MSSEELDDFSNSVNNDQRVSSRQRIYISLTKAGSGKGCVVLDSCKKNRSS